MTDAGRREGVLFVLSAPSGTGKSSVARRLLEDVDGLEFSVSYTTRSRRPGERDGSDYHFVDRPAFDAMIAAGELLEWAEVYGDQLYGTGRERTLAALAEGRDLLLDIDVQGARQVREAGVPAVLVMLLPPDYRTLAGRLEARGSESGGTIGRRLAAARREVEEFVRFDYVVINDRLEQAAATVAAIVTAERRRSARSAGEVRRIIASFPA
jgi:guanylate kinase